ncbi:ERAD-associated E3 ubiquitin-protein ligase DOA10 [Holothuria leucospilota]|uniref:ERAD-associated E3 ubiquitin-protein ligase DOA10 n=1 Tax=Holothuria leucospilota TaxID=206669 RepID=A0A9Q1HJP3_HOLLE|nr:ERAD-associated E3 ubiquitin-protein ligase DOA10 [Holothuria leucospilota]
MAATKDDDEVDDEELCALLASSGNAVKHDVTDGTCETTKNELLGENKTTAEPTFNHVLLTETDVKFDKPTCRICQGTKNGRGRNRLVAPCGCKGSTEYVHKKCLRKWCATKKASECEICQNPYQPRFLQPPSLPKRDEDSLVSSSMLLCLLIGVFSVSVYLLIAHLYAVDFEFSGDCWLLLFLVIASLLGLVTFLAWFTRNFARIAHSRRQQLREANRTIPMNVVTSEPGTDV